MIIDQLIKSIESRSEGRFEVIAEGDDVTRLRALCSEELNSISVIRLRRVGGEQTTWRTFLITLVESQESIVLSNRWASEVRDRLVEPETADLYLFILKHENNTVEADLESDELFCRKFVMRPNENIEGLLDRTFLTNIFSHNESVSFADPLETALSQTEGHHTWFESSQQGAWRAAFLSGKTGADLAEMLLASVSVEEVSQ